MNIKDILVIHSSRLFEVEVLELVTLAAQKYQDSGWLPCYFVGSSLMVTKWLQHLQASCSQTTPPKAWKKSVGFSLWFIPWRSGAWVELHLYLLTFQSHPWRKSGFCLQWSGVGSVYSWNSLLSHNRSHVYQGFCVTTLGVVTYVQKVPNKHAQYVCVGQWCPVMPQHAFSPIKNPILK